MEFYNTLSPTLHQAIVIGGTVGGGLLTLFKGYPMAKAAIELYQKKRVQPKLAISFINGSRMRGRANDAMYHPFELGEDRVITFNQQKLLSFDWQLKWNFIINITNQTEHTAYKVRLIPFPHEEQYISIHFTPSIDYTKAFTANKTETYEVVCVQNYRCTSEEADVMIKKYPMQKLRIEHSNSSDFRFATDYITNEPDVENKNVYHKLGKPKK